MKYIYNKTNVFLLEIFILKEKKTCKYILDTNLVKRVYCIEITIYNKLNSKIYPFQNI